MKVIDAMQSIGHKVAILAFCLLMTIAGCTSLCVEVKKTEPRPTYHSPSYVKAYSYSNATNGADTDAWKKDLLDHLDRLQDKLAPCRAQITNDVVTEFSLWDARDQAKNKRTISKKETWTKKLSEKRKISSVYKKDSEYPTKTVDLIENSLLMLYKLKVTHPEARFDLSAAELDILVLAGLINFKKFLMDKKLAGDRITVLKQGESYLKTVTFNMYQLKTKFKDTDYFKRYVDGERMNEMSRLLFEVQKQINQKVNSYYDVKYGYEAKYRLRVNPNDPVVIQVTDELTMGQHDKESIKQTLFQFVRRNVKYRYDPQWGTDWVQPPALTLVSGYGDCEDHAILLASMLLRAGISNVKLSLADTKGKGKFDHMFVSIGHVPWDTLASYEKAITWKRKNYEIMR